ncbi:MAG: L,D-transpeptidase [Polyangiaceae bacterium]|nr:L,D-transpeptidase [Polyangiaceae bacterium]MCW5790947.1 L,D-transpeptidase [Polyangiaceae bacterium]
MRRAGTFIGLSLLASTLGLLGCSGPDFFGGGEEPSLSRVTAEGEDSPAAGEEATPEEDWSHIPVPPADGPLLAALSMRSPIYPKPTRGAQPMGYLRAGARVPRSKEPVSQRDCKGGWYAIRPVGFMCADKDATTDLEHPIVRSLRVEPNQSMPMPYKYAFVRAIAPNYLRVPTKAQQLEYEMNLERHLRSYSRMQAKWDALDVGANDVPLDERGHAIGGIPDHVIPMDMSVRYGGDGHDEVPWWLENGERKIPNISHFKAPEYAIIADRIKRHAGVALIGTFVAGEGADSRRFAITTDARLIPADKLKADSGSPFHGYDISKVGLPVAFARKAGATWWDLKGGKLTRGERLGWREFIPLTGKVQNIQGVRMVESRSGRWLRSEDLKTAVKPRTLPSFARRDTRWIDIGIVSQTLVLWEGDRPVYATLVSTGRDGMGDPTKTLSTPRGTFEVYQKHVTTTMDSQEADHEFELRDVPWVMYFKGGYAIHGAYWHDDFGRARSHGCINLAPVDARIVFQWASPHVPEHWHAAYTGEQVEDGTRIHIHP